MGNKSQLVVFLLDEQRYALSLSSVVSIVRAVEVTALPQAPEIVLGVINLKGQIAPVIDIRRRFRLREKEVDLNDHFVIARAANRTVVLIVDSVLGVIRRSVEEIIAAKEITPGIQYVAGIVKLPDGMILIHDLNQFLSLDEETKLDQAIVDRSPATTGGA